MNAFKILNDWKYLVVPTILLFLLTGTVILNYSPTNALVGSAFNPGNIIDDGVFYNPTTMSVTQIQSFLEDMLNNAGQKPDGTKGGCDTNGSKPSEFGGGTRAQYAASNPNDNVHGPPYICLSEYYENTTTKANNLRGRSTPAGAKSAAQIIFDVAQSRNINPKVLLVLLQKEQILITDDWPVETQFRSATGYGCPDGAACNSNYYGFYNQVYRAAWQFNYERQSPNLAAGKHRAGINNTVLYSPIASCGSSSVFIENQATASLYNYTPYQPNQAALDNLYGSAPPCGAYGNRNFWRMFIDWFGTNRTNINYGWVLESQEAYVNSARTHSFTSKTLNLQPGETAYLRVRALNLGVKPWDPSFVRLGASKPNDRISPFKDSGWLGSTRTTNLLEASVAQGEVGTFEFSITAPSTTGTYKENYNLVAEGITWMKYHNFNYVINVTNSVSEKNTNYRLLPGESITNSEYLLSRDTKSTLYLQNNGTLVLRNGYVKSWSKGTGGTKLAMQTDGNLVLYKNGTPLWNTVTNGNPGARLILQTDGNMVVYGSDDAVLWSSYTVTRPSFLDQVTTGIENTKLFIGQSMETADRKYRLILQSDGNLVLYSPTRAIWANYKTIGKDVAYLAMQSDGNLVIYSKSGKALWHTHTNGRGPSSLVVQPDGNLVLYDAKGRPTWHTRTYGVE